MSLLTKHRTFKAKELEKILFYLGFEKIRQKGSHAFYRHPNGKRTTIPHHKGKDISHPLFRAILREINISVDEFYKAYENI